MHDELNKSGSVTSLFLSIFILYLFVPIVYEGLQFNQINIYFSDYYGGEIVIKYDKEQILFLLALMGSTIISFYTFHYFLTYYTFFSQKVIKFFMFIFILLWLYTLYVNKM